MKEQKGRINIELSSDGSVRMYLNISENIELDGELSEAELTAEEVSIRITTEKYSESALMNLTMGLSIPQEMLEFTGNEYYGMVAIFIVVVVFSTIRVVALRRRIKKIGRIMME